jgi:hypothetical protein
MEKTSKLIALILAQMLTPFVAQRERRFQSGDLFRRDTVPGGRCREERLYFSFARCKLRSIFLQLNVDPKFEDQWMIFRNTITNILHWDYVRPLCIYFGALTYDSQDRDWA